MSKLRYLEPYEVYTSLVEINKRQVIISGNNEDCRRTKQVKGAEKDTMREAGV